MVESITILTDKVSMQEEGRGHPNCSCSLTPSLTTTSNNICSLKPKHVETGMLFPYEPAKQATPCPSSPSIEQREANIACTMIQLS